MRGAERNASFEREHTRHNMNHVKSNGNAAHTYLHLLFTFYLQILIVPFFYFIVMEAGKSHAQKKE